MAIAYTTLYDIAKDPDVQKRVQVGIVGQAITVQAEDETTLTVPPGSSLTQQQLHNARSALAYAVLRDPAGHAQLFALAVVTDASIAANTTDAQLQTIIANKWNAFAINGA